MGFDKTRLRILDDRDLEGALIRALEVTLAAVHEALFAHAGGRLLAPPRFVLEAEHGRLVFTAGAETRSSHALGFRDYETCPDRIPDHAQLVAVWDARDGRLLGVLGTGFQARHHALAALLARPFEQVRVYSRSPENRAAFARWLASHTQTPVEAVDSAKEVVRAADVLLEVTSSRTPVFDPALLKPGAHVSAVGPKLKDARALPLEAALGSDLRVSAPPARLEAYGGYFLPPEARRRVVPLSALVAKQHPGRRRADAGTVFLSAGLAGTEPVVARRLFETFGGGGYDSGA